MDGWKMWKEWGEKEKMKGLPLFTAKTDNSSILLYITVSSMPSLVAMILATFVLSAEALS